MVGFAKGDVVRLKSGGPRMTVTKLGDYEPLGPREGVHCTWFDEKRKVCSEVFDAAALSIWEDPNA